MTVHFAAARTPALSPVARALGRRNPGAAANDNAGINAKAEEALLQASLRHFAKYGLSAANQAKTQAETAFFAGDRAAYDHWLQICRALDRRMAARLADGLG